MTPDDFVSGVDSLHSFFIYMKRNKTSSSLLCNHLIHVKGAVHPKCRCHLSGVIPQWYWQTWGREWDYENKETCCKNIWILYPKKKTTFLKHIQFFLSVQWAVLLTRRNVYHSQSVDLSDEPCTNLSCGEMPTEACLIHKSSFVV